MTPTDRSTPRPPSLADLTARFVATAPVADAGTADVEPYEVVAGFRTEPRAAWAEATAALKLFGIAGPVPAAPTDWASAVRQTTPATALPLCLGHFPQQVSDLAGLLAGRPAVTPPTATASGTAAQQYAAKAERSPSPAGLLVAAAVARLAGEFDTAQRLLARCGAADVVTNEQAALLWQRGEHAAALAAWGGMSDSPTKAFNLGMGLLFIGRSAEAHEHLTRAVAGLPASSGWRHLAELYLAMAAAAN
jgi:hypothetical protein